MSVIELRPVLDEAERFLRSWPVPFPVLSASHVDPETGAKGRFETRAFAATDLSHSLEAMRGWLTERQADRQTGSLGWANLYYSPNSVINPVDKKTERTDIAALVALHVDLDVKPSEDQESGIRRLLDLVEKYAVESPPGSKHFEPRPPSDIIISGGGVQGLWRLASPVPINGSMEIAQDLKRYNQQIERDLGGDKCHNVDRILRIPGTVNVPDAGKLEKHRKPALAKWYSTSARTYTLADFIPAPVVTEEKRKWAGATFNDTGEYEAVSPEDPRLNSLDIKWKRIGREGDVDRQWTAVDGKTDRSRMALAFASACLRAKIDPKLIASIIMDKTWVVGACIRDKGGTVKRHLTRLIDRAQKFVEEDLEKPAVLGHDKWAQNAESFVARTFSEGLVYWRGDFYVYRDGVYLAQDDEWMDSTIWRFLRDSLLPDVLGNDGKWSYKPFNPCKSDVAEMHVAIKNLCMLDPETEQPCWIEQGTPPHPPADECINLRNGILHVPSRTLLAHTPDFFTSSLADYDYDPGAACPVWDQTISQYWPEDGAQEGCLLQEMFGYSLLPLTFLQKLFAVVGPGRSGKGTLSRVLTLLVGKANIVAPTLKSLGTDFGRQSLINKLLALIGEAAFGAKDDKAEITNFLKTVSGEDPVSIPRKYQTDWEGRLIVRFWMFCNQITDFHDSGKALMMRIVPLKMTRSFADNPDVTLGDKLEAEIGGILNWALAGYDQLIKSGGIFTMPEASFDTREMFGRMASPLVGFLEDHCIVDPSCKVDRNLVYLAYKNWCETVSMHPKSMVKAIEDLISLEPAKLKLIHTKNADKSRGWVITGMCLKNAPRGDQGSPREDQGSPGAERRRDKGDPEMPF